MAYTTWPIERQFGNTIQWQYQVTGQGTPSSVSLKPENPGNHSLLLTTWTIESTGAGTFDFLPSGVADITGVTYGLYINPPDETEEMSYIFPAARATSQFGFGSTLSKEILLRPEFGCVFNVSSIIDSSGSNSLAIMFKVRGTIVDPATTTPFS
jgi:hypothetical protein